MFNISILQKGTERVQIPPTPNRSPVTPDRSGGNNEKARNSRCGLFCVCSADWSLVIQIEIMQPAGHAQQDFAHDGKMLKVLGVDRSLCGNPIGQFVQRGNRV